MYTSCISCSSKGKEKVINETMLMNEKVTCLWLYRVLLANKVFLPVRAIYSKPVVNMFFIFNLRCDKAFVVRQ